MSNTKVFSSNFTVDYFGMKNDLTITFPRILSLLQETSILHACHAGYPLQWFASNKTGFVLVNWQVEVYEYPEVFNKVEIRTWPTEMKGILAQRFFEMKDTNGRTLAMANSRWVFNDFVKARPIKIPAEITESFAPILPENLDKNFTIPLDDDFITIGNTTFLASRRDLDSNNHVNNVKYVEWALDLVPDDLFDNKKITALKTVYKKECAKGSPVVVCIKQKESECIADIKDPESNLYAKVYIKFANMVV